MFRLSTSMFKHRRAESVSGFTGYFVIDFFFLCEFAGYELKCFSYFIHIFCYFGYIILFNIKLLNISIFYICKVPYITSVILSFWLYYSIQY
jgi:hypothetical protein